MKQRVAIIGTGISGLTCGYLLSQQHDITVFESNDYIGGHTATKQVSDETGTVNIDTGFIVFNDWTYPNFIKLIERLGVEYQPTEMSFSVTSQRANLEYNGHDLNSLFAQRRNLFRPRFWRMLKDIVKFNKACKAMIDSGRDTSSMTLGDAIDEVGAGSDFTDFYILPMCAAIWSSSLAQTRTFPLTFFLRFFKNHGLLNITDRPQWYTIKGGSNQYIKPLIAAFSDAIHLNRGVKSVEKSGDKWQVTDVHEQSELFDHVIFACHSDQALAMMKTDNSLYAEILDAIPYADNDVVLHTDTTQLPKRKRAWASWNYQIHDPTAQANAPATVTYDMNILQRLALDTTYCVTLNNTPNIKQESVIGAYRYAHPQFSEDAIVAQNRRGEICGVENLHFCGAYWYNGFHEDGVRSALDVCKRFGASL